jgi:MFS family permease
MSTVAAEAVEPIRWRTAFGARPSIFVCCMVVWTLTNLDQSLFSYLIPGILEEFHQPLAVAGIMLTVAFVFAPVIIVFAGMAADRYGRDTMLWFLLASSALFVGLQGVAGSIVSLTIFRALGFGLSGSLSPITNAITIENAAPRLRGVAMGVLQCGYPIGWFIASMIVAPVLSHYSWRAACFAAFAMIPVAVVIAFVVRASPSRPLPAAAPAGGAPSGAPTVPRTAALRRLFAPDLRWHTLASFTMFLTFGGAYAGSAFFFPTYFVQARHYTPSVAASIVGSSNFVAIIGYLAAAFVGEFLLTRRTVFSLWCLGGALALAGLLWASTGMVSDIVWYSLMAILFFGTQAVVATFIGEVFPADIRTTALAFCGSAPLTLGFAIFPSVVPAVIGAVGWAWGLSLVVIPLLVASAAIAQFLPNVKSGHGAE